MDLINKTVTVLGSTGSVGTQALDVIAELQMKVRLLAGYKNVRLLSEQISRFSPEYVYVADAECARELRELAPQRDTQIIFGEDSLLDLLCTSPADITVHSIAGLAGLKTALCASCTKTRLAMANKEAIICAGDMIFENLRKYGGELVPVDSEHSAIFQCLAENRNVGASGLSDNVSRLILTASGGPFFGKKAEELKNVTPQMALAHPTWEMGPKITVDSATLMNKGFEIIEAVRLFGVAEENVDVVVHRQSIIHSMVEYIDNTVIAQLGAPDMRSAVRYAVSYPGRVSLNSAGLDFAQISKLTFDEPDCEAFPLLNAGRIAYRMGKTAPASLISADECAVDAFIHGRLGFSQIADAVFYTLDKVKIYDVSEESIFTAVREAEEICSDYISKL